MSTQIKKNYLSDKYLPTKFSRSSILCSTRALYSKKAQIPQWDTEKEYFIVTFYFLDGTAYSCTLEEFETIFIKKTKRLNTV